MSAALTVEELAEIAAFARAYPEAVPQMLQSTDPRELLERVRITLQEVAEGKQASQQAPEVESAKQPPDRPVSPGGESQRKRRPRRHAA